MRCPDPLYTRSSCSITIVLYIPQDVDGLINDRVHISSQGHTDEYREVVVVITRNGGSASDR